MLDVEICIYSYTGWSNEITIGYKKQQQKTTTTTTKPATTTIMLDVELRIYSYVA